MRIIFDLRKVGLGDNGGSSTIINSANTLTKLGNEVYVIDSMRNMHTWTKLEAKHIIAKNNVERIPDADFIIATGYKSVGPTLSAPSRCGIKMHWMRGWETWQMHEQLIIERILTADTIKLVNGIGLQKKLKKHGCKSHIVRPGYDIDNYKPLGYREKSKDIILGALYNEGGNRNNKRCVWICETLFKLKSIRRNLKLWLFGTHPKPRRFIMDNYLRKPTLEQKNEFYNHINIWLAPTMLEGLHMPPAEAMMTECPVVGTNAELSGMHDYLIDKQTGLVSGNNLIDFIDKVKGLMDDRDLQTKMGKSARQKILSLGGREENMKKFTELLNRLKNENI